MSNNRLVINTSEFIAELRKLPADLKGEASGYVTGAANGAAAQVKANYTRGKTGNLIAGVVVEHSDPGPFAAGAVVKSKAKHAWMYENGTQLRHNAKGANRGVMPAAPPGRAFIPVMIKARRKMYDQLKGVLERHGLRVSGNA